MLFETYDDMSLLGIANQHNLRTPPTTPPMFNTCPLEPRRRRYLHHNYRHFPQSPCSPSSGGSFASTPPSAPPAEPYKMNRFGPMRTVEEVLANLANSVAAANNPWRTWVTVQSGRNGGMHTGGHDQRGQHGQMKQRTVVNLATSSSSRTQTASSPTGTQSSPFVSRGESSSGGNSRCSVKESPSKKDEKTTLVENCKIEECMDQGEEDEMEVSEDEDNRAYVISVVSKV